MEASNILLSELKPKVKDHSGLILCTRGSASIGYSKVYNIQTHSLFLFNSELDHIVHSHTEDFEIEVISTAHDNVRKELFAGLEEVIMHYKVSSIATDPINDDAVTDFLQKKEVLSRMDAEIAEESVSYRKGIKRRIRGLRFQEYIMQLTMEHFQFEEVLESINITDTYTLPLHFVRLANQNYQHRDLEFFANKLGVTIGQLNRAVKNHYMTSPHDLLAKVTINQAKTLLKDKRLCLKEIAAELAFPDQSTFQRYFKKNTGMTPREFQEKYKKE